MFKFLCLIPIITGCSFQQVADYYNSADPCQLRNYYGDNYLDGDPSVLPSYCGGSALEVTVENSRSRSTRSPIYVWDRELDRLVPITSQ